MVNDSLLVITSPLRTDAGAGGSAWHRGPLSALWGAPTLQLG